MLATALGGVLARTIVAAPTTEAWVTTASMRAGATSISPACFPFVVYRIEVAHFAAVFAPLSEP